MTRRPVIALAVAVAVTAVGTADAAEPDVRASLEPSRARVGEVLAYTVTATLASAEDARDARIEAPPGALEIVGRDTIERDGARVSLTQRLACLGAACVPGDGKRSIRLPAARVTVNGTTLFAEPAVVTMVPLVPAAAVRSSDAPWRRQTGTPGVETRVPPGAVTIALSAAALALAAAAVLIGAAERRRRRRVAPGDVDELRRALRLVRESAARDARDRRRAAGLLSRVTRRAGEETTAGGAARVAWSQPEPAPADVHELADTAERAGR